MVIRVGYVHNNDIGQASNVEGTLSIAQRSEGRPISHASISSYQSCGNTKTVIRIVIIFCSVLFWSLYGHKIGLIIPLSTQYGAL
jgi:hypothetical protein